MEPMTRTDRPLLVQPIDGRCYSAAEMRDAQRTAWIHGCCSWVDGEEICLSSVAAERMHATVARLFPDPLPTVRIHDIRYRRVENRLEFFAVGCNRWVHASRIAVGRETAALLKTLGSLDTLEWDA